MLVIASSFQADFQRLGLNSFETISRFFLPEPRARKTTVVVRRHTISRPDGSPLDVFFKQYEFASPSWRFLARASKARREFDNYETFDRLGIPYAEPVAVGEERDAIGRLCRAFIVTQAISEAPTLVEFWRRLASEKTASSDAIRKKIGLQLAGLTHRIHAANFFHHDLVWRNILVTSEGGSEPKLWWIDCPRGSFDAWSPFRRRKMLKDLASLDKSAAKFCTRRERLAFLKAYLGRQSTDHEVKSMARDVVEYRRARWPEDWEDV